MENTIFDKLADGLDASTDGRGWDAGHERARQLANAAPAMLAALQSIYTDDDGDGYVSAEGMADILAAIAAATGTPTADAEWNGSCRQ